MKKLIPCLLLLCAWTAQAQTTFEGTIKWSMKMEITDPAMKAKMEEGMKKMADPANQAKMKELQAKMNDPQMKALFDSNPQMKTQMENALKLMAGGDLSSMMPKGFIMQIKNENVLTKMDGGPMQFESLYLKDKDMAYTIDRQGKTYSPIKPHESKNGTPPTPPKVTKTSETTTILGYRCTKYNIQVTEAGRTIDQVVWTTTDIKDIDLKAMAKQRVGRGQALIYEGMEGVPLRVEAATPEGKFNMEVTEITKGGLNAADFKIPADFKETAGLFK